MIVHSGRSGTEVSVAREVGNELEAMCGKCGEAPHVVVAVAKGTVAQVECKQCHARHRLRLPKGKGKPARGTAGAKCKRTVKKDIIEADPSRPPRPFSMNDTYQVGDRVIHASFGDGVVQAIAGPAKVEILFEIGSKIMVQGRSAG